MKPFIVVEPFLKELPEGWAVHRLRRVSDVIEETNSDANAPLLSLTIGGELLPRADDVQPPSAEYLLKYGLVRVGDLVVNPMWLTGGSIGVSAAVGAVSPEYRVYRFGRDIHPRFVHHLVRSDPFMHQYRLLVRAETTFDRRVTKEDFRELPLVLPPLGVQRAIADYLDTETGRIDVLIAKKQRMIELLREQFESRLAAAFDVEGVPTPALSVVVRIAEGQVDPTVEPFASMMLVAPDHVESGSGRLSQAPSAAEQGAVSGKYLCEAGDVIYSKIRPALRKVCIATERCLTSADMYPMRPSPELMPPYLSYFLLSDRFSSHAVLESERVAMPKINRDAFGRIRVPIPPKAEQQRVVEELDTAQSHLERVTDRVRRQIDLLREHRQALITAAVTGELEIPGEAA